MSRFLEWIVKTDVGASAEIHEAGIASFIAHRTQRDRDLTNVIEGPHQQANHGEDKNHDLRDRMILVFV